MGAEQENDPETVLVILAQVLSSAVILAIVLLLVLLFVRCWRASRSVKLENALPGSLDDEFEVEERLAELSPNEQSLFRAGRDFIQQHPPLNDELSLSSHLLIQEKGVEAWEFVPDASLHDSIIVHQRTELSFTSFDFQCSVQTNLPIPKVNDVYYFETKLFALEHDTTVSVGLATKPYPQFRLPGRHLYSVAYDSSGARRVNNSFKLTATEATLFPSLQKGDVIGVGYRVRSGTIFFTRNGKKVSEKAVGGHIKGMRMNNLFPTVGANNPCTVHVNLGFGGFVFIEANIKKWGYAAREGTRPPLPEYSLSGHDLLLESANEDEDEVVRPPDFYENAAYESSNGSIQDDITLDSLLPEEPPIYEASAPQSDEDHDEEGDLLANTERNQIID